MKKVLCMFGFLFICLASPFIKVNAAVVREHHHVAEATTIEARASFYNLTYSEPSYNNYKISATCSRCNWGFDTWGNPCSYCSLGEFDGFPGIFFEILYTVYNDYIDITVYVYTNKAEVMIDYVWDYGTKHEYIYFYSYSYTISHRLTEKTTYNMYCWIFGTGIEIGSFTLH